MTGIPELIKADKVDVTVLVDNYTDMLVPFKGSVATHLQFSMTRTPLAGWIGMQAGSVNGDRMVPMRVNVRGLGCPSCPA
jgi:hypothetical protein